MKNGDADRKFARWLVLLGCAALLALAGCSDDGDGGDSSIEDAGVDASPDASGDVEADGSGPGDDQPDCDPLQPDRCELPWPSNLFLKPDDQRTTGYTLNFGENTLPAVEAGNNEGTQTRPDPYRRLDGYGVGTPLVTLFPNVDTADMAGEGNIERSVEADSPIVWLEVDDAGQVVRRIPHFAELDLRADQPDQQALIVRPMVILDEATRYVVAFRNLQDTSGGDIEPSEAFAKLVDGDTAGDADLEARQERFDEIFDILEGEGVQRDELTLAWDYVTASSDALHGSMLHMRDEALETVGDDGAEIEFVNVEEHTEAEHDQWWLEIRGTITSPNYMKDTNIDGYTAPAFNLGDDGMPEQNGTVEQLFWLYVPHSARSGDPHGLIQYGHGQLGTGEQTGGGFNGQIANDYNFIFFGISLSGFSEEDVSSAVFALNNLNGFPFVADRLHQGLLESVLLARSVRDNLADMDEISTRSINVDSDELYYSGISQGGIFGASFVALSPDITYGHLGVPGNNYSTLLHRSKNFEPYETIMDRAYTSPLTQLLALQTIQLLWDQSDPVSYLRHITAEPFDGQDPSYVLLAPAKGDYQVSVMTNEVAARSGIDIALMENYGADVALVDEEPYPYTGSGVVLYDFGNPWPEAGNLPPEDDVGDPHGKPRRIDEHNEQMIHFFQSGAEIMDVCGGQPCVFGD
jgi:hypothetical protein